MVDVAGTPGDRPPVEPRKADIAEPRDTIASAVRDAFAKQWPNDLIGRDWTEWRDVGQLVLDRLGVMPTPTVAENNRLREQLREAHEAMMPSAARLIGDARQLEVEQQTVRHLAKVIARMGEQLELARWLYAEAAFLGGEHAAFAADVRIGYEDLQRRHHRTQDLVDELRKQLAVFVDGPECRDWTHRGLSAGETERLRNLETVLLEHDRGKPSGQNMVDWLRRRLRVAELAENHSCEDRCAKGHHEELVARLFELAREGGWTPGLDLVDWFRKRLVEQACTRPHEPVLCVQCGHMDAVHNSDSEPNCIACDCPGFVPDLVAEPATPDVCDHHGVHPHNGLVCALCEECGPNRIYAAHDYSHLMRPAELAEPDSWATGDLIEYAGISGTWIAQLTSQLEEPAMWEAEVVASPDVGHPVGDTLEVHEQAPKHRRVVHGVDARPRPTRAEWMAHYEDRYEASREHGSGRDNADAWARNETERVLGEEPE